MSQGLKGEGVSWGFLLFVLIIVQVSQKNETRKKRPRSVGFFLSALEKK